MSRLCVLALSLLSLFSLCLCTPSPHFRSVSDYGAKGDGVTDDTQAFIDAITDGRGVDPNAKYPNNKYIDSTTKALQVFVPSGTYVITGSLPLVYYTQLIGDSSSLPVLLVRSNSQVSLRVLDALEEAWSTSVNQNNFYRVVRNIIVDMTQCQVCTGSHWQVAQATSMINVHFKMGTTGQNQGIWMENGSGGYLSDCSFDGGLFGLWVGTQQFTTRNLTITNARTAIYLNWDWNWSFKSLFISDSAIGIDVGGGTGGLVVLDSVFRNVPIAVRTGFNPAAYPNYNQLLIDNVEYVSDGGVGAIVQNVANGQTVTVLPAPIGTTVISQWAQGHVWSGSSSSVQTLNLTAPVRPASLLDLSSKYFFESMRPDYFFNSALGNETQVMSDNLNVVNVVTLGLVGDGVTDCTTALQSALNNYVGSVLFFPHGDYLLSNTVYVPPGSRLLGQAWSVLTASGSSPAFSSASSPTPMLQVGRPGDEGVAHIVDMLFSTTGPAPGAVLLEWNMRDENGQQGQTAMWDTHFRVGGAVGTNIRNTNCPAGDGKNASEAECTGAYLLMHVTATASIYMENVWGWVADHDIDNGPQLNVYNARGFLCEAKTGPVWMYGTAFEHSTLYQYNFHGASNVFLAMVQTETAYYQPSSFTPFQSYITRDSDPSFCTGDVRCNMSLAVVISQSSDIHLYGSGLYSFFNTWSQDCLKASPEKQPNCQLDLFKISSSSSIYSYALNTYGSVYSLTSQEQYSLAVPDLNTFCSSAIVNLNVNTNEERRAPAVEVAVQ